MFLCGVSSAFADARVRRRVRGVDEVPAGVGGARSLPASDTSPTSVLVWEPSDSSSARAARVRRAMGVVSCSASSCASEPAVGSTDVPRAASVSYTHLTLPTKRIV